MIEPTQTELVRLRLAHRHAGATGEEFAALAGWKRANGFHIATGRMCFRRRAWLPEPDYVPEREDHFWTGLLFEHSMVERSGRRLSAWALRPATERALRRLGYLN